MEESKTSDDKGSAGESDAHTAESVENVDVILDFFDQLQERMAYSPLFLFGVQSTDITDLVHDCLKHQSSTHTFSPFDMYTNYCMTNRSRYDDFIAEYESELRVSYNMMSCFLNRAFKFPIHLRKLHWGMFCFIYTD
jgi:hypothetical protein